MKIKVANTFNFLIPYNVPMLRLGKVGDCGNAVPAQALAATNLISMGLGTNWSFDQDWHTFNPTGTIHGYDGTIFPEEFSEDLKADYKSFFRGNVIHFKENVGVDNIDQILGRVQGDTFLKIDIEGHEYTIIPAVGKAQHVMGMIIEFHGLSLDFDPDRSRFKSAINALANYKIVHVHANNFGGISEDSLPHTLEISFLRNDLCTTEEKRYDVYLKGLDTQNSFSNEDYELIFSED